MQPYRTPEADEPAGDEERAIARRLSQLEKSDQRITSVARLVINVATFVALVGASLLLVRWFVLALGG